MLKRLQNEEHYKNLKDRISNAERTVKPGLNLIKESTKLKFCNENDSFRSETNLNEFKLLETKHLLPEKIIQSIG